MSISNDQLVAEITKIINSERDSNGDIQFVEVDTQQTKLNLITFYEAITQRTLGRADPVRIFLEVIAYIIIMQRIAINYTGKMNLLKYSMGSFLEELGYLVGVKRLNASSALTTIEITLSEARGEVVHVPKGTRVTAGDNVFFAITEDVFIAAGQLVAQVTAQCTTAGEIGNGYLAGEINKIVDPIPFVDTMVNTTPSQGGANIEEDEPYRQRIHEAPESFSVAGPDGAYRFWAMTANPAIIDVKPRLYPNPGDVTLYVLLKNGELPGQEVLDQVYQVCNADDIRPLTDHLYVEPAEKVDYDLTVTYYIHSENAARVEQIKAAVQNAINDYILWQKAKIGRDLNPSELIRRMVNAGAKRVDLTSPVFTLLQEQQVAIEQTIDIVFGGVEDD